MLHRDERRDLLSSDCSCEQKFTIWDGVKRGWKEDMIGLVIFRAVSVSFRASRRQGRRASEGDTYVVQTRVAMGLPDEVDEPNEKHGGC